MDTFYGPLSVRIESFHSRSEHLCKFIGTKGCVCIRKEFNSHRICLGHQHGRRYIVLGHQHGRHDVMWKHSINARSSQSMIIGIDLSIDESIKIGKSDLIDIDCIDQSVEKDVTLDLPWFLPISSICIARYICSSKNENWIHATSE